MPSKFSQPFYLRRQIRSMQALVCGAAECSIQASSTMSERGVAVLGELLPKNDQKVSPINKVTRKPQVPRRAGEIGVGRATRPFSFAVPL